MLTNRLMRVIFWLSKRGVKVMIIEKENILELKIKLGKCRMACADLGRQIDETTDPVLQEKLRVRLKQEKNEMTLLAKYIENIEKLYHVAQNGDVMQERVEVADEDIEKMCNEMQEEFQSKEYNPSIFGE